jgi:predicted AlkP superfamily phosphohydrolase/phosphomutase
VLAVGLDAAEPTLVRRMIEDGELPAMRALLARGAWWRVESPAEVGSGAVWPTFVTGTDACAHGIYGEWCWQPETMSLERFSGRGLKPFWAPLARDGVRLGLLDMPFAPVLGLSDGFEVAEWGAHDAAEGRTQVSPASLAQLVAKTKPHPFGGAQLDGGGPDDGARLKRLGAACLEGIRLRGELAERLLRETRPDLAVITFTELHRAAHQLWHTVAPEHPFYTRTGNNDGGPRSDGPQLRELYRAADAQLANLVEAAGPDACVMVFALHGMRPARGIPDFLEQLMVESGWAHRPDWSALSWRARALSLFAAAKRRAPPRLRRLYYKAAPRRATYRLARPTMLPAYDWSRTRAFALPTDQHGWLRLNLVGREARGVVPARRYEETCRSIESMLRALRTEDGRPLVRDVIRTARDYASARAQRLPDLIVHYDDGAFTPALKIGALSSASHPVGMKNTGQHAPEGFLLLAGQPESVPDGNKIRAQELGQLLIASLARNV